MRLASGITRTFPESLEMQASWVTFWNLLKLPTCSPGSQGLEAPRWPDKAPFPGRSDPLVPKAWSSLLLRPPA